MDQIEDVSADLVHVKNEQCIVVRTRDGKIVLTNPVGLRNLCINFISIKLLDIEGPLSYSYSLGKLFACICHLSIAS
jgi:beta-adrenergic-receptor kinase